MSDEKGSRVRLGDFVIEKKIGEGGMGTVFMARQESLDRVVALKILPKSFAENPEFVERFRREARAAASLVHPNVVQIYSVGEERGVPYFAMELVDGASLDQILGAGKRFEMREAAEIALQVARALGAAYEKGLVHRDIKPANVMLDRKSTVKVTDFGLAKPASGSLDITQPGLVVGTPTYMSPEQGAGEEVGPASDIYSLGVVLYEMLTGRAPFQSDNVGTIIYQHLHEPPDPPSALNREVPRDLEAVVLKCLGKHPEDRYSAGELVGALGAFLGGERQVTPAPRAAAAPRPADVTLPVPTPTPITGYQGGAPGTLPPFTATPATVLQPVPARKGSGVLAGFLAAVLLMAAGGGAFYYYWFHMRGEPGGGGNAATNKENQTNTNTGPGRKRFTLDLAPLKGLLPEGSKVELVTAEGPVTVNLADPQELELPAGSYQLNFSRQGYKSAAWQIKLSAAGASPELDENLVRVEPGAELLGPYESAEKLLAGGEVGYADAQKALKELEKVAALEEGFRQAPALRKRASQLMAAAESRWQEEFNGGQALAGAKKWSEAQAAFEKLLREIPPGKPLYNSVQMQITTARDALMKAVGLRDQLESGIRKGEFERARRARKQLALVAAETGKIAQLAARLEKAEKLWSAAKAALDKGEFGEAKRNFGALLVYSPEFSDAKKAVAQCEDLLKTTDAIARAVKQADGQLATKNYRGCLATLKGLVGKDLGENAGKVAELRRRAEFGLERSSIAAQLGRLDAAFTGRDLAALKKVLDSRPAAGEFARGFEEQTRELFGSGIEISAWEQALQSVEIKRSPGGEPTGARARVTCSFEFGLPRLGRKLSGSVPLDLVFSRAGQAWLLAAAVPAGAPKVKSTGKTARLGLSGKVTAVQGGIVTVDRGTAQGIEVGMVFDILVQARLVRLPMTKETVFAEERPVAGVEVIEVAEKSARCAFVPGTRAEAIATVKPGMTAALSRLRKVARTFPVVAGIKASAAAAAGGEVTVSLEVKPVEGVFVFYRWSASGGVLSSPRTAEPSVAWTAPARAGEYRIVARVTTAAGRSEEHEVTVRSTGTSPAPPKAYALEATIAGPDILGGCTDLAFDARGYAYALDGRNRQIVLFDPQFRPLGASNKYASSLGFERIAVGGEVLYCLDAKSCSVKRYSVGQAIQFAKEAGPAIGGRGEGNGKLRAPLDLALSSSGELYVLDAPEGAPSVQVFTSSGSFVQSFGAAGGGGKLEAPVALAVDLAGLVHVLDAGRRRVVSFAGGRPAGTFKCAAKGAQLADLAYDASTDSLIVLDAAAGQAAVYSISGEPRSPAALGRKTGVGSLKGASRLAANRAGGVLVALGEGKLLDRYLIDGTFLGRVGGGPLSACCKIAAGPDETWFALDTSTSTVRAFDGQGWMLGEFGGRKAFRKAEDLVADAQGLVYVLDSGDRNVKVFDAAGRPKGTYGKRGRPPTGLEGTVDLATDGARKLGVLCYQSEDSIFHYELGGRAAPRVLPAEKGATPKPKLLAVDLGGRSYFIGRSGQVDVWDAGRKKVGTWQIPFRDPKDMEACAGRVFVLDGRMRAALACDSGGQELARIKLPRGCSKPADLAASDYEVVYVYDAGSRAVFKFRAGR